MADLKDIAHRVLEMARKMRALHQEYYSTVIEFDKDLQSILRRQKEFDYEILPGLVDAGWMLRQDEGLADDWRKECKARRMLIGKIIGVNLAKQALETGEVDRAEGEWATADPQATTKAKLPKKGEPEYEEFCKHFGVTEEAMRRGVFTLHWNHISDLLTEQAEKGLPLPPGIRESSVDYDCIFRKKRGKEI